MEMNTCTKVSHPHFKEKARKKRGIGKARNNPPQTEVDWFLRGDYTHDLKHSEVTIGAILSDTRSSTNRLSKHERKEGECKKELMKNVTIFYGPRTRGSIQDRTTVDKGSTSGRGECHETDSMGK